MEKGRSTQKEGSRATARGVGRGIGQDRPGGGRCGGGAGAVRGAVLGRGSVGAGRTRQAAPVHAAWQCRAQPQLVAQRTCESAGPRGLEASSDAGSFAPEGGGLRPAAASLGPALPSR